jgi:hypothetical protein
MTVQETDASIYEWSTAEELTVYDVPASPTQTPPTPAPPTDMTLTSGASTALIGLDGSIQPRIQVQWDVPLDILVTQIQVQYALTSNAAVWIDAGLTDVGNLMAYISGVVCGQQYNVRIRSLRANGAASPWEEINGYTVSITLSVVGILALAPGSLVAEAYPNGTASITVSGFTAIIGNASVAVLPGPRAPWLCSSRHVPRVRKALQCRQNCEKRRERILYSEMRGAVGKSAVDADVGVFLDERFMPDVETTHRGKQKTIQYYKQGCSMLKRSGLAGLRLDELTGEHCGRFAAEYKRLSASGINMGLRTMRRSLNLAYQWGVIESPSKCNWHGERTSVIEF